MPEYKHWKNYPTSEDLCFVTTGIEERVPVLGERENAQCLLSALDFYREKHGVLIHAYVVMLQHLHVLLRLPGTIRVEKLMADYKRFTSKQLLEWCESNQKNDFLSVFARRGAVDGDRYSVWERSFRSVPVFNERDAQIKIAYTHNNPVRAGIVERAEDWWFSSASAYAGGDAPIAVDIIQF